MAWVWTGPAGDRAVSSQADDEARVFSVVDALDSRYSPAEALAGKLYVCLNIKDVDMRTKVLDRVIDSIGKNRWDLCPQSLDLADLVEAATCWCEASMKRHVKEVIAYAQQIGVRSSKVYTVFGFVGEFSLERL
ncbi:MAG: hypothetical protein Q7R96_03845 [Nanoarchaeota archaeon]|nr:hypothetical protein [Nanoarchaeota archaeon]